MTRHPIHMPSFEVTIETKRHRSTEVDTVFTSARCDADVTGAPSRATYRPSKSCSSASKPSESNCVTGTPRKSCRSVLINRHFVVASFVRIELRFRHVHDRCAREPIKRSHLCARVRARVCIERTAATSRGKTRGNLSRNHRFRRPRR